MSDCFTKCLQNFLSDKNFLVVIFFHNFDNASSTTREWLKYWFSHEAWAFLGKLIVVVTGTSKLEFLDSLEDKPCRLLKPQPQDILEFIMDWLNLCGYAWATPEFVEDCKGDFEYLKGESIYPDNFEQFSNYLDWKRTQKSKKFKQADSPGE